MSTPTSLEAAAIEAAYEEQVKTLFKVLTENLAIETVSHENDQQSVAKFAAGLTIARRAKDLALDAVMATPPATNIATTPATKTAAKSKKSKKT